MKRLITICLIITIISAVGGTVQANLIINGDFENNTAVGTMYNLTNAEFNATVANATAFGNSEEIDLLAATVPPKDTGWKLGLHQYWNEGSPKVDAFSFDLSSPVVSGNAYSLQFFAANQTAGPVEIGLSSSASDFGTLIFSGTPVGIQEWTQFNHDFVAPVDASFLTVRNAPDYLYYSYVYVDNFSLVPEPATICLLGLGALALLRRKK